MKLKSYIKMMKKNSSVVVSLEDIKRIKDFIKDFEIKTGFKISISQFVKKAINKELEFYNIKKEGY